MAGARGAATGTAPEGRVGGPVAGLIYFDSCLRLSAKDFNMKTY
jgi:hypothetical protein